MNLAYEEPAVNGEANVMDRDLLGDTPLREPPLYWTHFQGMVRQKAYIFCGHGNFYNKEWDLAEGGGNEFCWYMAGYLRKTQPCTVRERETESLGLIGKGLSTMRVKGYVEEGKKFEWVFYSDSGHWEGIS